jgi:hypothetical protein
MKYLDLAIANEQIKTTDIKGKDYAEVNQRIKAFRMVYPQGSIRTEMLSNENGVCVFRATAWDETGTLLASGHAYEKEDSSFINKTSYIENCETSAIGRCLGIAGFGIDVSVASAEEVANAIQNQTITQEEADSYTIPFGKYKGKTIKEIYESDKGYIEWMLGNSNDERMIKLIQMATGIEIPTEEESKQRIALMNELNNLVEETECDYEALKRHYKVKSNNEMTVAQLQEAVNTLKKRVEE